MPATSHRRKAFTIFELCAVIGIIGILVSLVLPAVQASREQARRVSCSNNLMQIAIAVRNYQSTFGHYPVQLHGTDGSTVKGKDNDRRLSFLVGLLPFLDRTALSEMIDRENPRTTDLDVVGYEDFAFEDPMDLGAVVEAFDGLTEELESGLAASLSSDAEANAELSSGASTQGGSALVAEATLWPRNGPEPFQSTYRPWVTKIATFRCPSDPGYGSLSGSGAAITRSNYAACLGDGLLTAASGPYKEVNGVFVLDAKLAQQTNASMRGVFVPRVPTSDADVTDGISHTILLGEIITALGDDNQSSKPAVVTNADDLRDNPNLINAVNVTRIAGGLEPLFGGDYWSRSWRDVLDPQVTLAATGMTVPQRRGLCWSDGMPLYTGFNTILPPNREIALSAKKDDCWGILPPSSRHSAGVTIAMVDGATRFISNSIDAGDINAPTVYVGSPNVPGSKSPYGVWGALGTRASGELSGMVLLP